MEKISEQIRAAIFPNLKKTTSSQIQVTQQTPNRRTISKLTVSDYDIKILKAAGEKQPSFGALAEKQYIMGAEGGRGEIKEKFILSLKETFIHKIREKKY